MRLKGRDIMQKNYQDKNWLEQKINDLGNKEKIGRMCGVTGDTIEYWRRKFNIKNNIVQARKISLNESFFDTIDTEEKAYWLGFIMADGCVASDANCKECRLVITLKNADRDHLRKFSKAIAYNGKILDKELNDKRGFTTYSSTIRINSKKVCSSLKKYGVVSRKTGKEIIPENIPKELIRHFIRGFFDGDGSITKSSSGSFFRFKLGSSSKRMMIDTQNWLIKNGIGKINFYEDSHYKTPFYVLESNKEKTCNAIFHLIYDESRIYLDRKYNRAKTAIDICPPTQ